MIGAWRLLAGLGAACALAALAGDAVVRVDAAWSRALPPVSRTGAVYLTLVNTGREPDALVSVHTDVAEHAQLHEHTVSGGLTRMQAVASVALAPGQVVRMQPGGLHVMLGGLKRPLAKGDRFAMTLRFARAGAQTLQVQVLGMDEAAVAPGHPHAGHGKAQ